MTKHLQRATFVSFFFPVNGRSAKKITRVSKSKSKILEQAHVILLLVILYKIFPSMKVNLTGTCHNPRSVCTPQ